MQGYFDFDAFLTSEAQKLTRYCAAIVGSADAEDAAQEAFIRVWQNLYRIPDEKAAAAFLYRTAYRLAIDTIRRRKRFREPEMLPQSSETLSDKTESALMQLSPIDRAVLYSRVVDACEYSEIAARFHKNEAWARKRYSLARQKLAKILGKEFENE